MLNWTPPANVNGYTVKYSRSSTFSSSVTLFSPVPFYNITGLADGSKYYIKIAGLQNGIEGATALVSTATWGAPAAPTLKAAGGLKRATLTWAAPASPNTPIVGYRVDYATSSSFSDVKTIDVSSATLTTVVPDLNDGTGYFFRVRALNLIGESVNSATATATTASTPAAVTGLTATAGAGTIRFAWTAPAVNGGSPITGYKVDYSTDANFTANVTSIVVGNATSYSPTGLAPETTYYGKVSAVNAVGVGAAATAVSASTLPVSAAPNATSLTATALGSVKLMWVAPTNTGGSAITGYNVQYSTVEDFSSDVVSVSFANVTSGTLVGLKSGTSYYVRVAAKTAAGTGSYSNTLSASTWSVPNAPALTSVVGGNKTVKSLWTAPVNTGGSPILGYRVQYSTDQSFATNVTTVDVKDVLTYTALGLPNDAVYYVRVSAKTIVGFGGYSAAVDVKTFALPDAPAASLTSGLNSINVTWTAPVNNGGSPVTGYRVEYSVNQDMSASTSVAVTGSVTFSKSITGLKSGTTYYSRVYSRTLVGESVASSVVSAKTVSAPPAPVVASVSAAPAAITVAWLIGGPSQSPVTGYRVEYSTSPSFLMPMSATAAATATSLRIQSLSPNTTYYARVYAKSAAGEGLPSNVKFTTTPAAPNSPTNLNATSGYVAGVGAIASLTWTAPSQLNGYPVTGYRVQYSTDSTFASNVATVATNSATASYTLKGLASNTSYSVKVAAITAAGVGEYSNVASVSTVDAAAAPKNLVLTNGVKTVGASWNAVGGVSSYSVQISTTNSFSATTTRTVTTSETSYTFEGLLDNKTYYVRVAGVNDLGAGVYSIIATKTTFAAPIAPKGLTASDNGDATGNVAWTATVPTATAPVSGYRVQYSDSSTFASTITTVDVASVSTKIEAPAGLYYVRVASVNAVGVGVYSTPVSVNITSVPSEPVNVDASLNTDKTVALSWNAPASNGGKNVIRYEVTINGEAGSVVYPADRTVPTANVEGLNIGEYYTFSVKAVNANGSSVASSASNEILTATAPAAPTNLAANPTSKSSMNLSWTAPVDVNNAPVLGYEVTIVNGEGSVVVNGTTAVATGLTAGETYTFNIKTVNIAGVSEIASVSKLAAVPADVPEAATVTVGSISSLNVAWNAPASNGAPITGYVVEYSTDADFVNDVASVNSSTNTATIEGLTAGVTYYVRVSAVNSVGSTEFSPISSGVAGASPDVVSSVNAVMTDFDSANVTWVAPSENGYEITGYRVQYSTDLTFETSVMTIDTVSLSTAINALASESTYYVRVAAINARGASEYSGISSVGTPSAPSEPVNVSSTVSSTSSVVLTWDAPLTDGGDTVTRYEVTVDGGFGTVVYPAERTAPTATVEGLTAGETYSFNVKAVNNVGSSNFSSVSQMVATAPDAASTLTLEVASTNSINASWTAPASNGSPITGYVVDYSTDSSFSAGFSTLETVSTSATLDGLTTGSTYYVRVSSVNALGITAVTKSIVVATAPEAPVVNVTTTGTSFNASWTTPASNGSPITGYVLEYSTDETFNSGVVSVDTVNAESNIVEGLTENTTYYVRAKTVNASGSSVYSSTVAILTAPAAVTGLTSTVSGKNVTLSWTAGPATITDYVVEYSTDGSAWTVFDDGVSSNASSIVNTLAWNTTYSLRVAAANASGKGSYVTVNATTPVATPTSVTVTAGSSLGSVNASWSMPTSGAADAVTGYSIQYSTDNANWTTYSNNTTAASTSYSITGLTAGTSYYVRVAAVSTSGATSDYKASASAAYAPTNPSTFTVNGYVTGSAGWGYTGGTNGGVGATWTAPASDGGSTLTAYEVTVTSTTRGWSGSIATYATSMSMGVPYAGDTYRVTVKAKNSAGGSTTVNSNTFTLGIWTDTVSNTAYAGKAAAWMSIEKGFSGWNSVKISGPSCPVGTYMYAGIKHYGNWHYSGGNYSNYVDFYGVLQYTNEAIYGFVWCQNPYNGSRSDNLYSTFYTRGSYSGSNSGWGIWTDNTTSWTAKI